MTEREKMLAGELYDCGDPALLAQWHRARALTQAYNSTPSDHRAELESILDQLLGGRGKNLWISAPFYVDYGENIFFGEGCEVNMNCVFLDDNTITIGDRALIGPGVHIYTAFHPTRAAERFGTAAEGFAFCRTRTAPVTVGNDVWLGGGSILLPGVTIGDDTVIGAGSVVTHSIPAGVVAVGNPCRVLRPNR